MTSLLLTGCGGDPVPPSPDAAEPSGSPQSSGSPKTPQSSGSPETPETPGTAETPGTSDAPTATPAEGGQESAGANEIPLAPEASPTSLSDLLTKQDTASLVAAPLPRAASALGMLVPRFPAVLRPPGRASVESSSIAPSGDRLQVGLVVSTTRSASEVLLAYRTRLTRRGMTEQATPTTPPGSQAAAFGRGRSSVTVTVTQQGTRTEYAVHASLHAGGA